MALTDCIEHGCKGMGLGYAAAWIKVDGVKKSTTKHQAVFYSSYGYLPEVVEYTCKREGNVSRPGLVNGRAKLSDELVRYLRQMYIPKDKQWGASAIAKRLGMGASSTYRMLEGIAWQHVN